MFLVRSMKQIILDKLFEGVSILQKLVDYL